MLLKNVLGSTCAFAAKHLRLRHRYVFTKNNRLRMRYITSLTAVMAAILPTAIAFSPLSGISFPGEYAVASVEPSVGTNDPSLEQIAVLSSVPQFEEPPVPSDRIVTISQGDALGKVMQREGVGKDEVHDVISAMKKHFDPRDLKAGQDVQMHFEPAEENAGYQLTGMKIELNPLKTVTIRRRGDDFVSNMEEKELEKLVVAKKTEVKSSIYGSAAKAGIPKSVVNQAIKMFSHNVDFQRDVRAGDSLEVMYETQQTEDGYVAKTGEVLFARLTVDDRQIPLYRYKSADGHVDYYGRDGKSMKKTLMKTPVDGARMSSGFGMRRHPVLGYSRMHKGVDFAAPTGTPIYAAGDGVVEKAGRFSSYGNYIRIRHRGDLDTAYGHMSKISVKAGARVRQGQVIGYVGSTGRSTGPHLHYEILVNNKQVNPRGVNLPIGQALAGADLRKFKSTVANVESQFAQASGTAVKVAQRIVKKTEDIN